MPLYRPTELCAWLDSIDAAPKKGLSQNFLIDGNVIRRIVAAGQVQEGDGILEIGPGPGALTEALLEAGGNVIAVERDRVFAQHLQRLEPSGNRLSVICEDILKCDLHELCQPFINNNRPIKILANLPYHITTPILIKLLEAQLPISHLVVMVQEEVARRMTADPGTKVYGSLSLFLKFYSHPTYVCKVSRKCFFPAPKVDSAVVLLQPKKELPDVDLIKFFELTRQAFGQRRKTLRAAVSQLHTSAVVTEALETLGINPMVRAEELSLGQFLQFYKHLSVG